MCGIAGKLTPGRPVDPGLLAAMCGVIEHRGPDSRGTFLEDDVALGIQRLRVIDLETGDQPIFNEDGSVVVVLNGEIYNYRELREQLRARGHTFATQGDTEVIVHLYEERGADLVHELRGMFAFALWDRRRRRLLLATDRVGKKPLFYAHRDGGLWFGSEAKSILEDEVIPRDVDLAAVDSYLHYGYVPAPLSAFAALRKLPPAHTLVFEDGGVTVERYWSLSYQPGWEGSPEEQDEAIRESLLEATRLRMRSDVPLGVLLSGGIDSSAIAAAVVREASGTVQTFAIGFDVEAFDETPHARRVAEHLGTEHHELRVEPGVMDLLPKIVWHYGEPFADSSALPSFRLAENVRKHVTVALAGDGGDECFAGYRRYHGNVVADRLAVGPRGLMRGAARALELVPSGARADTWRARAQRQLAAMGAAPDDRYAHWMAVAGFAARQRARLYTPAFAAAVDAASAAPAEELVRSAFARSDASTLVERMLDADVQTYLPGDLLVKMDIASMAHSLEVRSPMLDHKFMELAARLPADAKLTGATSKPGLRRAFAPWLPPEILGRGKRGFEVPLGDWLRGPLRGLPAEILLDPASLDRGWFSPPAMRRLLRDHARGRADHSSRIWSLMQLELWLRTFVDARTSTPQALQAV